MKIYQTIYVGISLFALGRMAMVFWFFFGIVYFGILMFRSVLDFIFRLLRGLASMFYFSHTPLLSLFSHTQVSGVNAFILTHPCARPLQAYVISFLGLTLMISSLGKFSVNLYL